MLKNLLISFVYGIAITSAFQKVSYPYKNVDGIDIIADVWIPDSTPFDFYPVVFGTHGGAYVIGDNSLAFSEREVQEIMDRGWIAVSIQYRLLPGALVDDIMQDVQDAWDWVHNELGNDFPLDVNRMVAFGGSAGGGLAVINGFKLNPRPQVVVAFFPFCTDFTDPLSYDPSSPLPSSLVDEANALRQTVVASYDPARTQLFSDSIAAHQFGWVFTTSNPDEPADNIIAKLTEYSAVHNIDGSYPPTYLAHGLDDQVVPYSQSVQMRDTLAAAGVAHSLHLVQGAGHGFDKKADDDVWARHVLPAFDFASQYMGI